MGQAVAGPLIRVCDIDRPAPQLPSFSAGPPDDLQILRTWWDDIGQPNSSADKDRVAEARIFGGQMTLKLTAAVPALMFVGYLLLVLHFRAQGGYRTVELAGESTHEPGD